MSVIEALAVLVSLAGVLTRYQRFFPRLATRERANRVVQTNVSVDLGSAVRELAAIVGPKPSAKALKRLEAVADGEWARPQAGEGDPLHTVAVDVLAPRAEARPGRLAEPDGRRPGGGARHRPGASPGQARRRPGPSASPTR